MTATSAANDFFRGLYQQGLFIGPRHAAYLATRGQTFLKMYMLLANLAYEERLPRFPLAPKFHYMHHVVQTMSKLAKDRQWGLNPISFAVQLQEDLVGRVARVSRRVSPVAASQRTLQRVLLAADAAFREDQQDMLNQ